MFNSVSGMNSSVTISLISSFSRFNIWNKTRQTVRKCRHLLLNNRLYSHLNVSCVAFRSLWLVRSWLLCFGSHLWIEIHCYQYGQQLSLGEQIDLVDNRIKVFGQNKAILSYRHIPKIKIVHAANKVYDFE